MTDHHDRDREHILKGHRPVTGPHHHLPKPDPRPICVRDRGSMKV